MKKQYMTPVVETVKIQTSGMLAVSLTPDSGRGTVSTEFVPDGTSGEGHGDDFDWDD